MVTNYPRQIAAAATVTPERTQSVFARAISRVDQLLCAMRGHDSLRHFERNRVMMRCTSCGHDTPGWEISGRAPRRLYEGDARRHLIVKPHLVLRKSA